MYIYIDICILYIYIMRCRRDVTQRLCDCMCVCVCVCARVCVYKLYCGSIKRHPCVCVCVYQVYALYQGAPIEWGSSWNSIMNTSKTLGPILPDSSEAIVLMTESTKGHLLSNNAEIFAIACSHSSLNTSSARSDSFSLSPFRRFTRWTLLPRLWVHRGVVSSVAQRFS